MVVRPERDRVHTVHRDVDVGVLSILVGDHHGLVLRQADPDAETGRCLNESGAGRVIVGRE